MSDQTVWTYVAVSTDGYDTRRDKLLAEERWDAAASIVGTIHDMVLMRPHMSMADVVEKFPDFRVILQDAGYPGYPSDSLGA